MSELPKGWATATIADLASPIKGSITDGPYGSSLKTSHYTTKGPRVIRLGNIRPGALDMSDEAHVSEAHFASLARHHVQAGDVVMAALGEPLGRACRVPNNIGPAMVKADCFRIRVADEVDPEYLIYRLNSVEARDWLLAQSHGLGRVRVNLEDVRRSPVPLPPLPEQRRIVAKLDRLSARSRAARDHLARTTALAVRVKQAILADALSRQVTSTLPLGALARSIRYGTSKRCDYDGGATPVLRIPNVSKGLIDTTDLKSADFDRHELTSLALAPGDLLMIRSNGSLDLVGRSALVEEIHQGLLFAGYLIRIRLNQDFADPRFIRLVLMSDETRRFVESLAKSTSGVNNINSGQIASIPIPNFHIDEQREVVRRIESAFARIDRLTAEAARARHLLGRLDERLLARAFRGGLVPQDPADEPASALLDRLRAARAAGPRRGRSTRSPA